MLKYRNLFKIFFLSLFWVNLYAINIEWNKSHNIDSLSPEEMQCIENHVHETIKQHIGEEPEIDNVINFTDSTFYKKDGKSYFLVLNGVDEHTILVDIAYICTEEIHNKMINAIHGYDSGVREATEKEKTASKKRLSTKDL